MVPFQGVHYHLTEWGWADLRWVAPLLGLALLANNSLGLPILRSYSICTMHQPCNVMEQIFSILKHQFNILICPPEYNLDTQAHVPLALAALHNFIWRHDPDEIEHFNDVVLDPDHTHEVGVLALGPPGTAEHGAATDRCSEVARLMWAQYQATLENRA